MHNRPVLAQTSAGQGDQEPSEESALAAMQIDKVSARQLLAQSLPVPSDVLAANQKALAAIGTKARQARQQGPPLPTCSLCHKNTACVLTLACSPMSYHMGYDIPHPCTW